MGNNLLLHITFFQYSFLKPWWLLMLLFIPFLLYYRSKLMRRYYEGVKFSRLKQDIAKTEFFPMKGIIMLTYFLLGFGLSMLILAFSVPTLNKATPEINYQNGIYIMIAMDVSGSMMATDFLPNRLEVAKEVAKDFVNGRTSDKIGFIAFEGEAYTVCPATHNYDYLKHQIDEIQSGKLIPGTAIGVGLGTAVARLRSDSLVSKVIILLTDGENNRGEVSPMEAAVLAKELSIKVYTIGVGKKGFVKMPIETPFGTIYQETEVSIDEDLLTEMAEMTGGHYFRATDEASLRSIYQKIDKMEKREISFENIQKEPPYEPHLFILLAVFTLLLGVGLEQILLRAND